MQKKCIYIQKNIAYSVISTIILHFRVDYTLIFRCIDVRIGETDKSNNVLNILEPLLSNKEVIVVYYKAIFEMTWDEITEETGIPSSTARLIYKQAKDKLKKELRYV